MKQPICFAILAVVVLHSAVVGAQVSPAQLPERTIIEQKKTLVSRILADSPLTDSILRGMSGEAREQLEEANRTHQRALRELERGDLSAADRSLNDAMRHIGRARSLEPNMNLRLRAEQARYAELMQSVNVLKASYLRNVGRRAAWLAERGDEDLARVNAIEKRAKSLAASGRYLEANATLDQAQRDMITSFNALLGEAPLIYDLRFGSAEDEYKYESERTQDYESLVPAAIQEYNPPPQALAAIDGLVTASRILAVNARTEAKNHQFQQAIRLQRESTTKLQQALERAGVVVPQQISK